jgi:hypothetical protein
MPRKTIVQRQQENFETIKLAFDRGEVCIMDCIEKKTGKHVAVICAAEVDPSDGEIQLTPLAQMFNEDPYETLLPPNYMG